MVLRRIASRVDGYGWSDDLQSMTAQLRALALTHRSEPPEKIHATHSQEWVLDPDWHPIAFEVASSRPRVLLTIGSNALQVVDQEYQDLLQEVWDEEFTEQLTNQRHTIAELKMDLLHLRECGLDPAPVGVRLA